MTSSPAIPIRRSWTGSRAPVRVSSRRSAWADPADARVRASLRIPQRGPNAFDLRRQSGGRCWASVGEGQATPLEDAPSLPLGTATPDAVLDAVRERVLQTALDDRAGGADLAGTVDSHPVGWEERGRRVVSTVAFGHPAGQHLIHHRLLAGTQRSRRSPASSSQCAWEISGTRRSRPPFCSRMDDQYN